MKIWIRNRQKPILLDSRKLRKAAKTVLADLASPDSEVSVSLVGDSQIRELNRRYLDRDKPTNVLAFSMREGAFVSLHPQLLAIRREWKVYSRLVGVRGIPGGAGRIDRFAFALEFIPGKAIQRDEALPRSFFVDLGRILKEVHERGVVHLDLRHKGNILASDEGEPFLIDFNWSLAFERKGFLYHVLFPLLKWVDKGGFLKLKQRVTPSSMTPEELRFLHRFNRIRKIWIFS